MYKSCSKFVFYTDHKPELPACYFSNKRYSLHNNFFAITVVKHTILSLTKSYTFRWVVLIPMRVWGPPQLTAGWAALKSWSPLLSHTDRIFWTLKYIQNHDPFSQKLNFWVLTFLYGTIWFGTEGVLSSHYKPHMYFPPMHMLFSRHSSMMCHLMKFWESSSCTHASQIIGAVLGRQGVYVGGVFSGGHCKCL